MPVRRPTPSIASLVVSTKAWVKLKRHTLLFGFCLGASSLALLALPWSASSSEDAILAAASAGSHASSHISHASSQPLSFEQTVRGLSASASSLSSISSSQSSSNNQTYPDSNSFHTRTCSSPEYGPWSMDGCTASNVSGTSQITGQTCGLCQQSRFARHLQELSTHIEAKKRDECQELVVFGAAFGKKYFDWIWKKRWSSSLPPKLHNASSCHFMLVLDETLHLLTTRRSTSRNRTTVGLLPEATRLRTGGQHVVGVRRADLPYQNHRRNIKLFKLNPHLLFPWAKRIIWVDAKMKLPSKYKSSGLKNYFEHFVQKQGVCGSVVSLPLHPSTMGDAALSIPSVRFSCQCDAIRDAFEFRPQVSDSPTSVRHQCEYYLQQIANGQDPNLNMMIQQQSNASSSSAAASSATTTAESAEAPRPVVDLKSIVSPPLDATMIDSAVLAWDLRHDRCRQFVANLLCTWLNEIHCFSDRDQLSFGYALHRVGGGGGLETVDMDRDNDSGSQSLSSDNTLTLTRGTFPEHSHRIYSATDSSNNNVVKPLLHFVKSRCHWYYGKSALFKCNAYEKDPNGRTTVKLLPTRENKNGTVGRRR